ncbi:hypothetical protein FI667_g14994, partial [Globisporangium splendens]
MTPSPSSPRVARPAAFSDDMEYEDKHAFPPTNRSHMGSPLFARHSVSSVSSVSSVENSPAPPSHAKSYANSPSPTPLRARHSESELRSPRNRSQMDEYPRYEAKKKMSADFSDDTMSVGSIGGESPKSDKGSWRIHSAVAGPFLTGPLARDFRSEDLKTPRGKARDDMNFDQTGLLFPLAPVLDVIPDTPRGPHRYQPQGFTDVSRFGNNAQSLDGFNLDGAGAAYPSEPARPTTAFNSARRRTNPQAHDNNYANYAHQSDYESAQYAADGQQYHENGHQSSAIVASHASSSASHAPSYADIVARNAASSSEQSLVSSSSAASDSLETLTKGVADSMAQILAKTQNGRTYGEVQLTTLVQKIHMHMNIMGRTSAAIREDYNKIKAKLEQTITDKKVLETTNYHLQQLVQQYEVERQYFHQYVLHSLQSQSSLIYESMGNLSQNVAQSKYTIEELSARLSEELTNMRGSRGNGNESQLKDILEEIKRAVDVSVLHNQNNNNGVQQSFDSRSQSNQASSHSPHANSTSSNADSVRKEQDAAGSGKLVPFLLALLLWIATLAGVYYGAKSSALSELQGQQPPSSSGALLPSDLDSIVDQISQKLESVVQTSDVRKLVYGELTENPHLMESIGSAVERDVIMDNSDHASSLPKEDEDAKMERKGQDSVETPSSDSGSDSVPVPDQVIEVADNLDIPPWAAIHMPGNAASEKPDIVEEVVKAEEKVVEDVASDVERDVTPQIPTDSSLSVQDPVDDAAVVEVEVTATITDDISDPLAAMFVNDVTSSSNVVASEPEVAAKPLAVLDSTAEVNSETGTSEEAGAVGADVESLEASESAVDTSASDVSTVLPGNEESSVVVPESEKEIAAEEDVPVGISSDFVEVALESAVSPDIIATLNPVLETAVESANLASTDADAKEEVDGDKSDVLEVDLFEGGVFEDVDISHVIIADAQAKTLLDSSDAAATSTPATEEEEVVVVSEDAVSSSAIEDEVEDAALQSSVDTALARFEEELSASTPVDKEDVNVKAVSENNAFSKDDEDVVDVQVDASVPDPVLNVISVDDDTKEESPFSGLSMALRSLARRIVGDVDVGFFSSEGGAEPAGDAIPEDNDLESKSVASSEVDEAREEFYEAKTSDNAELLVDTHEDADLTEDAGGVQTVGFAAVESQVAESELDAPELSDKAATTEHAGEEVNVAVAQSLFSKTEIGLANEEADDTEGSRKTESLVAESFDEDVGTGIAPSEDVQEPEQVVETVSQDDGADALATSDSVASELLQSVEDDVEVVAGIESASAAGTDDDFVVEGAKIEDTKELDTIDNDVPELKSAGEGLPVNAADTEPSSGAGAENVVEEVKNDDMVEKVISSDTLKTVEDKESDLLTVASSTTPESQNKEGDLEATGADSLINVVYDMSKDGSIEAVVDKEVSNLEEPQAAPEIEAEIVDLQNAGVVADVTETELSSDNDGHDKANVEDTDKPQIFDIQTIDPAISSDTEFTIDAFEIVNEITPVSEDLSVGGTIARTGGSIGMKDVEDDSDADGSVESMIPPSESSLEDQESSPLIDSMEPSTSPVFDNELDDVGAFESSAADAIEVVDTASDVVVDPELIESSDDRAQIDVAPVDKIRTTEPSTGDIDTAKEAVDEYDDAISPSLASSQEEMSSTIEADILEIDESEKTEGEKKSETVSEVEVALSEKSGEQSEVVIVADPTESEEKNTDAAAPMTINVDDDVDASTTLATETSVNDPESPKSTTLEDTETSSEAADASEEDATPALASHDE